MASISSMASQLEPTVAAASLQLDVLAIIDAMEAQGLDAAVVSAVADAIGVAATASLESLTADRVPVMKKLAIRKAAAASAPAHAATLLVR